MADYFQIYLCDPAHEEDFATLWTNQSVDDRIVAMQNTVAFGTGRNMTVPVQVIQHRNQPEIASLIAAADHAVIAGLICTSGLLKLAGCTDYLPDAFALSIVMGPVGAAFLSFGLNSIDGLDGEDRYSLHVWPAEERPATTVLKRWSRETPDSQT